MEREESFRVPPPSCVPAGDPGKERGSGGKWRETRASFLPLVLGMVEGQVPGVTASVQRCVQSNCVAASQSSGGFVVLLEAK